MPSNPHLRVKVQRSFQFGSPVHLVLALPDVTPENTAEFARICKFHLETRIIVLKEFSEGSYVAIHSDVSEEEIQRLQIDPEGFYTYRTSYDELLGKMKPRWPAKKA